MNTNKDGLLNKEAHTGCFLCDNNTVSIITNLNNIKGEMFQLHANHNRILFLLKGKINFLYEHKLIVFEKGMFVLLPRGYKYDMNVMEDSLIVIFNLQYNVIFCEHYPLETLYKSVKIKKIKQYSPFLLKINRVISIYLDNIIAAISDGLGCVNFHEKKRHELFYYLQSYYSKEELVFFFAPMLNEDTMFAELIYQNYESVKTVEDLARAVHYSISGFKKRFVKVFGISPYKWMEREKAKKIYYEINCTNYSFKEIASKYNFFSPSHFNRFCKKMFKMSPGLLRENTIYAILDNGT